jgi:MFS-type transporter involved in bile tolerance (Atg22 family)
MGVAVEAFGPIVVGTIYDLTNTYVIAFIVVGIFCALGLMYSISVRQK